MKWRLDALRRNVRLMVALVLAAGPASLAPVAQAAFQGANGKIAMVSFRDGNNEIYVTNPDGTEPLNLTNNPALDILPAWSPDGQKIAFTSYRNGSADVYVMNADGGGLLNLTPNTPWDDSWPAWSPDGQKIAFTSSNISNQFGVYVMNADGTGRVNLTNNPVDDGDLAWSPDGQKIAFTSYRNGSADVYVMNADGTGVPVNLTNNAANDAQPDWSPDGQMITFTSDRDFYAEVYVMNADGSGQLNLTNNLAEDDYGPAWSPDGQRIAFTRLDGATGIPGIYAMNADGTEQVSLTSLSDFSPDWQPSQNPALSIDDVTVTEGDTGTTTATFTVSLSAPSGQTVSVDVSSADGTATTFYDYMAPTGPLTFAPGVTTQTVDVAVVGDTIAEVNETFTINLSAPVNGTILDSQGAGTIIDDEPDPEMTITGSTVIEGDAGTTTATFVVLVTPSQRTVVVDYATEDLEAIAPGDYLAANGRLTFVPGAVNVQTISVTVNGDLLDELDERFIVRLLRPDDGTLLDETGILIVDDDTGEFVSAIAESLPYTLTTDPEHDGATGLDFIETTVQTWNPGFMSISERAWRQPPTAWSFGDASVAITAPPAPTGPPLRITFAFQTWLLPFGTTLETFMVFRNGTQILNCVTGFPIYPCVSARRYYLANVEITVLTRQASEWTFATAIKTRGATSGLVAPLSGGHAEVLVASNGSSVWGAFSYRKGSDRFVSTNAIALAITGRTAWFAGVGRDGRTYLAYVEDNGQGSHDVFRLWIEGDEKTGADGRLKSGNLVVVRP